MLVIGIAFSGASVAYGQNESLPAISIDDLTHQTLRAPVEYLVTDKGSTLESVRQQAFTPLTTKDINQGISGSTYWLRLRLSNSDTERHRAWVLHHETSYLDNLTIYFADNGGEMTERHLSDRQPFTSRPVDYRKLTFSHQTPAASHTDVYLRLNYDKADSISLNFHLMEQSAFQKIVQREYLLHGAYFGIMLALIVIALISATLLQQSVYVYYAAFLVSSALVWAKLNGFAFQYLWPESEFWHNEGFHIVFLLVGITAVQFSRHFLQTRSLAPRTDTVLSALQAIMLFGILLRFAGVYGPILYVSYFSLSLLILLPLVGLQAYQQGLRYARWFVLAWAIYAAGLLTSVISAASNVLHWGMEPLLYAQIGSLIESVLLLLALGERLMGWDRDRKTALEMANHDPLTGLGNRRMLASALASAQDRFATTGTPVFLLFIDLDHFKEINDSFGHDAGDVVLQEFARLLLRFSRPDDVCIRYGGEEFAVLFQAPSMEAAVDLTERIRSMFEQSYTLYKGQRIRHTLSAGLTRLLPDEQSLNVDDLMSKADAALYKAKNAGRNRTATFEQGLTQA